MFDIMKLIFIKKLLQVLLLDWLIRLRRSIINILPQIVCFQEVLNVSYRNFLCILPCSVSLTFAILSKNQLECTFLGLFYCRKIYANRWFSWDILSLSKSLPKNFKFKSSYDLVPRFLCLYWLFLFKTFKFYYYSVQPFHFMESVEIFRSNVNPC